MTVCYIWVPLIIIVVELSNHVQSDVFSSIAHLSQTLKTEIELAKQLDIYLNNEYKRLNRIKQFLNVIKEELSQAQGKEEEYFGNPINAYVFIKHLSVEWDQVKVSMSPDLSKIMSGQWLFPTTEDYFGTINSLLRLQETYQLSANQLANGKIGLNIRSKSLTIQDCYEIGLSAYKNGNFYYASNWMQETLDHFDLKPAKTTFSKIDILTHLAYSNFQQGNVEQALSLTETILTINPGEDSAINNKEYYQSLIANEVSMNEQAHKQHDTSIPMSNISNNENDTYTYESYQKLCRQRHGQLSQHRQAKLFCRYRHNNHPYLILGPIKEEQVLDEPTIVLYHEIISDTNIEQIKTLALQRLKRSHVYNEHINNSQVVEYRISKNARLRDEDSPEIARLSRLISALTNLTMETSEPLAVTNYGVGGHFEPHVDFFDSDDALPIRNIGNRIATWLTYMSNVEWGGATVFPYVGGYVAPRKGSAAFWYNLYASGKGDYSTLHAGCPVLIGNKWIATKWIHEYGQELRRPCLLDPMK